MKYLSRFILAFGFLTECFIARAQSMGPGSHLFFETKNVVCTDELYQTDVRYDLYLSASQAYVDFLATNGNVYGLQAVDVTWELDFGTNGTDGSGSDGISPIGHSSQIKNSQIAKIQALTQIYGAPGGEYDAKFKATLLRNLASAPLSTQPTLVASFKVTFSKEIIVGTPQAGAKMKLRSVDTGFGTGPGGSKWGDFRGNFAKQVGSNNPISVLPVILSSFNVKKEGVSNAILTWTTSDEVNSKHFEVERSRNGKNWQVLQTVASSGNSKIEKTYQAIDRAPLPGQNLYRLHMVDMDGSSAYSSIRAISFKAGSLFNLYPNPASDILNVNLNDWNHVVTIRLINQSGNEVYKSKGNFDKSIDLTRFPVGFYNVVFDLNDGSNLSQKLNIAR